MRFTIKLKLGLAFALIVIMCGAMAMLAIINLASLDSDISSIMKGPFASVTISGAMATKVMAAAKAEKDVVLATDPALKAAFDKQLLGLREGILDDRTHLLQVNDPLIHAKLDEFDSDWNSWIPVQDQIRALGRENTAGSDAEAAVHAGAHRKVTALRTPRPRPLNSPPMRCCRHRGRARWRAPRRR